MEETKSVHVQIIEEDAIDYKKSLLEIQLCLLTIMEKALSIKEIREQDFLVKNDARKILREIDKEIKSFSGFVPQISILPEEKPGVSYKEKQIKTEHRESKKMKIKSELESIKRRLERLA